MEESIRFTNHKEQKRVLEEQITTRKGNKKYSMEKKITIKKETN
jgi:hypothetical protein